LPLAPLQDSGRMVGFAASPASRRSSASGAPQVSPAREGWETSRQNRERRRCGTPLRKCSHFRLRPVRFAGVEGICFFSSLCPPPARPANSQFSLYTMIGVSTIAITIEIPPHSVASRTGIPNSIPPPPPSRSPQTTWTARYPALSRHVRDEQGQVRQSSTFYSTKKTFASSAANPAR